MAMTKALFGAWSGAVAVATSECVNTTLASVPAVSRGCDDQATAMDSTGNVWFSSHVSDGHVIQMCSEDGECVSKRTGESSCIQRIAADASGPVPIVYLVRKLVPYPSKEDGVSKCVWDVDAEEMSCSDFGASRLALGMSSRLAVDHNGNVFVHTRESPGDNFGTQMWKCSPSGDCEDFGGHFWDDYAPAHSVNVATDSQGNVYVSGLNPAKVASTEDDPKADIHLRHYAKCTAIGRCVDVTVQGFQPCHPEDFRCDVTALAVGPDDDIYMIYHWGESSYARSVMRVQTYQGMVRCSPQNVCNHVGGFDGASDSDENSFETDSGFSVGKHGDVYAIYRNGAWPGHAKSFALVRRCFPAPMNEIVA